MNAVLEGIKVVDFTWAALGPLTCDYLAIHGAEVVKVETQNRPDPWRTMSPFADDKPGLDRAGQFAVVNAQKYSLALNLTRPEGLKIAKRLVAWSDIVVESYRPGAITRLGLGYEELKRIKPDIIMLSTCMYGQTGPFAKLPGFGLTLTAASGISHLVGWPDRPPLPSGAYTDFVVPKFNVLAIAAALDYRSRTGKGQYLDISQLEAALHFLAPILLDYSANRRELGRIGNKSTITAPHGVYRCKEADSWCAIAVTNDEEWESLCRIVAKPELTEDPRFATGAARLESADELDLLIEDWTSNQTADDVMSLLQAAGISAGKALNGEQLDNDPQLEHRNYYQELDHPVMGRMSYSGMPVKMSATPYHITRNAPCLGEHTEYVCTQMLGMSDAEFTQLVSAGVFE